MARAGLIALVVGTVALASTSQGAACPPPVPQSDNPDERRTQAAYESGLRAGMQMGQWQASAAIVLAKVIEVGTTAHFAPMGIAPDGTDYSKSPEVTLQIVKWLKGRGSVERLKLHYGWLTSCGPEGPRSAVEGRVGDEFLLLSSDPKWRSENVVSIGKSQALTHDVRRALAVQ